MRTYTHIHTNTETSTTGEERNSEVRVGEIKGDKIKTDNSGLLT